MVTICLPYILLVITETPFNFSFHESSERGYTLYVWERSGIYVGVLNPDLVVYPGTAYSQYFHHLQGKKQYELTNHLGNVLNTINDRKIGVDTTTTDGHYDYSQDNDGNEIIMSPDAWHKQ